MKGRRDANHRLVLNDDGRIGERVGQRTERRRPEDVCQRQGAAVDHDVRRETAVSGDHR